MINISLKYYKNKTLNARKEKKRNKIKRNKNRIFLIKESSFCGKHKMLINRATPGSNNPFTTCAILISSTGLYPDIVNSKPITITKIIAKLL